MKCRSATIITTDLSLWHCVTRIVQHNQTTQHYGRGCWLEVIQLWWKFVCCGNVVVGNSLHREMPSRTIVCGGSKMGPTSWNLRKTDLITKKLCTVWVKTDQSEFYHSWASRLSLKIAMPVFEKHLISEKRTFEFTSLQKSLQPSVPSNLKHNLGPCTNKAKVLSLFRQSISLITT